MTKAIPVTLPWRCSRTQQQVCYPSVPEVHVGVHVLRVDSLARSFIFLWVFRRTRGTSMSSSTSTRNSSGVLARYALIGHRRDSRRRSNSLRQQARDAQYTCNDPKFSASIERIVSYSVTVLSFTTKRDQLTLCTKDL